MKWHYISVGGDYKEVSYLIKTEFSLTINIPLSLPPQHSTEEPELWTLCRCFIAHKQQWVNKKGFLSGQTLPDGPPPSLSLLLVLRPRQSITGSSRRWASLISRANTWSSSSTHWTCECWETRTNNFRSASWKSIYDFVNDLRWKRGQTILRDLSLLLTHTQTFWKQLLLPEPGMNTPWITVIITSGLESELMKWVGLPSECDCLV